MSNKIGKETIKKLIEEVLKEERLNEFTTVTWNPNTAKKADAKTGRKSSKKPNFNDFKKIANAGGGAKDLSQADINAAAKDPSLVPILRDLAKNSNADIANYINSVLGSASTIDAISDTSVPNIDPDNTPLKVQDAGVSVDQRTFDQPLGRVDPGAAYDLNAKFDKDQSKPIKQVGVNSTLFNVFRAVPGEDLAAKLSYLKGVADLIQNDENLSTVSDDEIFKISNAMMVFNNLANLAKAFDDSSAGFQMESMLAGLVLGFKPKGKGTSDVISYLSSGKVFYSSKFTMEGGANSWLGPDKDGMKYHLKKGDIYYANIQKVGATGQVTAATAYNQLDIKIVKLLKHTSRGYPTINGVRGQSLKADGTFTALSKPLSKSGNAAKVNFLNAETFLSIPLLQNPDASYVKIGERIASYIEDDSDNDLFKAILDAAQRLQNMQKNTEEYRAAKGSGQAGQLKGNKTASAKAYVNAVATDYTDIKASFKRIFKSDLGTQTAFNESKVISPNFLKKLIEESFKK